MNSNNGGSQRTVLRIKRRRNEQPLPFIRLEGLGKAQAQSTSKVGQLSSMLSQAASIQQAQGKDAMQTQLQTQTQPVQRKRKTCAMWKRRKVQSDRTHSYKIVDAKLETVASAASAADAVVLRNGHGAANATNADANGHADDNQRSTKRPKLTVLETNVGILEDEEMKRKKQQKKRAIKVLDPLTRMVDDSLQRVHSGEQRVQDHFRMITTDSVLATHAQKWLSWCHSSGGNLLHACALWNDVDTASDLCRSPMLSTMASAWDGDGRTPYELSEMSGHGAICEVLEAFGGDAFNYVYDVYDLEAIDLQEGQGEDAEGSPADNGTQSATTNGAFDSARSMVPSSANASGLHKSLTVELKGGVGYWTQDGELILEAPATDDGNFWDPNDSDDDDEDEVDSNCEQYGGNDYPDDDWGADSDDEGYDATFRDRHVDFDDIDYIDG